jgi:predicted SAM-dependent methyltransferase
MATDLKNKLIKEGKTRWLDIGCGGNFEKNFYYLDIFPIGVIDPKIRKRYFRADIVNVSSKELKVLGKFDLVRMQHVFEHFSFEDGQKALKNCARLLKNGGVLLISVPDLKIHLDKYFQGKYKDLSEFQAWAQRRIPKEAPASFYFSVFAHGIAYGGAHLWCYDFEGLKYQLETCGGFKKIIELKKDNSLASIPFTHNMPQEDLCIVTTKAGIF